MDEAEAVRLPFALPCAAERGDAASTYLALRARDKQALLQMSAQRKLLMVRKGSSVVLSHSGNVAAVVLVGAGKAPNTCYIPLEMMALLRKKSG